MNQRFKNVPYFKISDLWKIHQINIHHGIRSITAVRIDKTRRILIHSIDRSISPICAKLRFEYNLKTRGTCLNNSIYRIHLFETNKHNGYLT